MRLSLLPREADFDNLSFRSQLIYKPNDVVTSGGSTYVCIKAGFNQAPASSPTYWLLIPGTASGSFVNPMTTTGDIIVGSPGSTPARIPKGASPSLFGVDGAGNMGYRQLVAGDLPALLVGTIIYDWVSSADYWTGQPLSSIVWTTIGSWSFTPRRANSLIQVLIAGYIMVYGGGFPSPIAFSSRWNLDGSSRVGYIGGGESTVVNMNYNMIDGNGSFFMTGLTASAHTLILEAYGISGAIPVYWRSVSTANEQIHVQVIEWL